MTKYCILFALLVFAIEAKGARKMEASGLEMESNDTIGEDMFSVKRKKDGDKGSNMRFGFAKIIEVDNKGAFIEVDKHFCDFRKTKINCTKSAAENGTMNGFDEEGNITSVNYTRVTTTCSLAACNTNANAAMKVKTYIMKKKAYICTPECNKDSTDDQNQSPVFDGTAKWELEITDWDFCESGTCNGKAAEKLKIFFKMGGKKGGKDMGPKKKAREAFDTSKISKTKLVEMCKKKANATENADKDTKDISGDKKKALMKLKGKGICRKAKSKFGDKPDDQDSFKMEDADGKDSKSVFRLFSAAIADDKVVDEDSGFEGPNVEEETVGKKKLKYVTIAVNKFSKAMYYDPTADVSEEGGTGSSASKVTPAALTMISLVVACFLQ